MASGEDRPIIVSGGDQMITITLPDSTTPDGGSHILNALQAVGPFKTIVVTNPDTNEPVIHRLTKAHWTITIE